MVVYIINVVQGINRVVVDHNIKKDSNFRFNQNKTKKTTKYKNHKMEIVHKTQFAQFEKDFSKLPQFLQKKLQEAMIANAKKFDADRVTKKLERAEKKLQEQRELKEMKNLQRKLNVQETLERGRQAKQNKNDYYNSVIIHKQKVADEVYAT